MSMTDGDDPLTLAAKSAADRVRGVRDGLRRMLVPPATTDSETLGRWPADQAPAADLEHQISGDISARVAPDAGVIDAFPTEHPWAAVPFATQELLPVTFDAPPTSFVAEQPTAQPAAWARRVLLNQYQPFMIVPADTRPRRILLRVIGAGNVYIHGDRPQGDGTAGTLDTNGFPMVSTDSPQPFALAGALWVVSDTATNYVAVFVDYSAIEATRPVQRLADKIGSVLASSGKPCGCHGSN